MSHHGRARDLAERADVRQAGGAVAGLEDDLVLRRALEPRDDLLRLLERPGVRLRGKVAKGWCVDIGGAHRFGLTGGRTVGTAPCAVKRKSSAKRLKRADWKISEPQIRELALLPDPEQGVVQRQPDRIVAAFDRDADALAEVAAVEIGTAAERTAVLGIGAVEPERERDRVAEHQVDVAALEREAGDIGVRIGARLDLGEQRFEIGLVRRDRKSTRLNSSHVS